MLRSATFYPNPCSSNACSFPFHEDIIAAVQQLCTPSNPHERGYVPLHYVFYNLALSKGTPREDIRDIFLGIGVSWVMMSPEEADPLPCDEVEPPSGPHSHYTYANTHPMCALRHSLALHGRHANVVLGEARFSADYMNKPARGRIAPVTSTTVSGQAKMNPLSMRKNFLTLEELHRLRPDPLRMGLLHPTSSSSSSMEHGGLADDLVREWYGCSLGPGGALDQLYYGAIEALFGGLEALSFFSARPSDKLLRGGDEEIGRGEEEEAATECLTPADCFTREWYRDEESKKSKRKRGRAGDGQAANPPTKRRKQCQRPNLDAEEEGGDDDLQILDTDNFDLMGTIEIDMQDGSLRELAGINFQAPSFERLSMITNPEGRGPDPRLDVPESMTPPFCPSSNGQSRYVRRLARLMLGGQCNGDASQELPTTSTTPRPKRMDMAPALNWTRRVIEEFKWNGLPEAELRCYRGLLRPFELRTMYQFDGSREVVDRSPEFSHCAPLPLAYSDFGTYQPDGKPAEDALHRPDDLFPLWHSQWRPVSADHIFLRHIVNLQGDMAPFMQSHPQLLPVLFNYPIDRVDLGEKDVPRPAFYNPDGHSSFAYYDLFGHESGEESSDAEWTDLASSLAGSMDVFGSMSPHISQLSSLRASGAFDINKSVH